MWPSCLQHQPSSILRKYFRLWEPAVVLEVANKASLNVFLITLKACTPAQCGGLSANQSALKLWEILPKQRKWEILLKRRKWEIRLKLAPHSSFWEESWKGEIGDSTSQEDLFQNFGLRACQQKAHWLAYKPFFIGIISREAGRGVDLSAKKGKRSSSRGIRLRPTSELLRLASHLLRPEYWHPGRAAS